MPISVRLDKQTETFLEETSRVLRTSKAEVIKRSLADYCSHILSERRKRPYELIHDLIGTEGSGRGDLSVRGEEILRKTFRRKG
ncbi:MAG: hypothetical protein NT096_09130 [Proteobacteria bacterium]|nr:hypothetical protein [Pseudomonadota bacterium]